MRTLVFYSAALALCATAQANAQGSVSQRIAAVRDGVVRMQYDSRPGVCGDGKSLVSYRSAMFAREFSGFGRMSDRRCVTGPLRVTLVMSGGHVTQSQTQVGGAWPTLGSPVTDLGVVLSSDAALYFFTHVGEMESISSRDRLLMPAVLADADVMAPLLTLARDDKHMPRTRRQAIQWLGLLGDAGTVPALVSFTRGATDPVDDSRDSESLSSTATSALSMLDDGAGISALMQLARKGSASVRRNAVFWLAQNGDPRGLKVIHTVIEDAKEDARVRKHAIFSLGSNEDVPTLDLVAVYSAMGERSLQEQAILVISQRDDDAAVNALMKIARDDPDVKMRSKALFWLAQKHDPRATKLIGELVLK
ncbi:hypothetical protein BH11GEM2_BH11GEM2_32030 [soil metagenome]